MIKKSELCLILTIFYSLVSTAQNFDIILGRPTDSSITASVMFDKVCQFYFEYSTTPGLYSNTTASNTGNINIPIEVDFNNLSPNTRYYYRMKYKLSTATLYSTTNEYSFITQRSKGSSFCFTIESDEHLYDKKGVDNMFRVTLENQANDKPDFMLTLGDIFGDDHTYLDTVRFPVRITNAEVDSLHKDYRRFLGNVCHSIPFYIALGNHEGEKCYYLQHPTPPENLAVYATIARKKYYPNPYPNRFYSGNADLENYGMNSPENYYAWTWGDALFVVMDVYRYDNDTTDKPTGWNWTLGLKQYLWLKNTLTNSTSKYKFVFCHHVRGEGRGGYTNAGLCEWGGYNKYTTATHAFSQYKFYNYRDSSLGWTKPIHALFKDNGVNVFFQGHDHVFAHEIYDGVTYQSCPMAADSTYEIGMLANADAYLSDTLEGTGHIRVNVNPSYAQVDYVRAYLPADVVNGSHQNGEVAFSYKVRSKSTYSFVGNGNWTDPANWVENAVPPATLPSGYSIYIEPIIGGQCILNTTQTISSGAKINVNPNCKLIVPGALNIQ